MFKALLLVICLWVGCASANSARNSSVPMGSSCTLASVGSSSTGCSTSAVEGLTYQIIQEMSNGLGYKFVSLDPKYIHCSSPCVNQLQESAASALAQAAAAANDYITLNSATRSSAQQYVLYQWYRNAYCGIGLAAKPGTSNHEGGRAIDTSYYSYWTPLLAPYGWVHSYPDSDPVHFDYLAAQDLAQENLKAFQRLYNRNEGGSLVEDGLYGPATEAALAASPCDGW